jgi:two-component system, NarL family, nitrate/nitrite response regulator NarL
MAESVGRAGMSGLSLLVVDGTRLYREALAERLRAEAWVEEVRAEPDAASAVVGLQRSLPDVAVVQGAFGDGPATVAAMRTAAPGLPVVVLVSGRDENAILAYAEVGVTGFLEQEATLADLRAAVEAAVRGETLCSPLVAGILLRRVTRLAGSPRISASTSSLTPREREVLSLIERGMTNKEIAVTLRIEVRTVKNHVHNLLEKLRVSRRGEAAARLRGSPVPQLHLAGNRATGPGRDTDRVLDLSSPNGHRRT